MTTSRELIRNFIMRNFVFDEDLRLADDLSFLASGIIDSTGMLELIGFLETEFGISFNETELVPDNLDSIDRIVAFLTRRAATNSVVDAAVPPSTGESASDDASR